VAYLKVRVTPKARGNSVEGWSGDVLRVRVQAVPERGKANEAVCRLLAEAIGVPASRVSLRRGESSREKLLFIDGLSDAELRRRLPGRP
jgi:hypothetical protein